MRRKILKKKIGMKKKILRRKNGKKVVSNEHFCAFSLTEAFLEHL
jgi:hypothetical protein